MVVCNMFNTNTQFLYIRGAQVLHLSECLIGRRGYNNNASYFPLCTISWELSLPNFANKRTHIIYITYTKLVLSTNIDVMDMRQCFWWVLCEENYRKKRIALVEVSTMNVTHKYHTENHTNITCTLMHLWQASYNAICTSSNPRNHPAAYYPVWRWMLYNQNMARTFDYNSRYESQGQGEKWSSNLSDCSSQQKQ